MVTYLLLRDNKQLGPLTLDQLLEKGIKAYDLVWVEGKSAAWRYPSELEELKAFAPVVEEQPFDRFYKRPAAENKSMTPVKKEPVVQQNEPKPALVESPYANTSRGDKKVYVTLPATRPAAASVPLIKKTPVEESKPVHTAEQLYTQEKSIKQPVPRTEFLQPVEEEKNQFVEKNQQRNLSISHKKIFKPVLVAAGIILILATGIFIGLYINKSSLAAPQTIAEVNKATQSAAIQQENKQGSSNQTVIPVSDAKLVDNATSNEALNNPQPSTVQKTSNPVNGNPLNVQSANVSGENKDAALAENRKTASKKARNILPQKIPINSEPVVDSDFSQKNGIARRQATHRGDEVSDKAVLKSNIAAMVGLSAGKYTIGTFGGISNLQLTVSNHSAFPLDLVVVEVQYIQANKKIFKTENVYFRNIGAGSALMQEAPKSPRGIKVEYKVVLINSKESGLSYTGA
jgi:hypothetical protein